MRKRFDALDTDHNGSLDVTEVRTFLEQYSLPQEVAHVTNILDMNRDTMVSKQEFLEAVTERSGRLTPNTRLVLDRPAS